MKKFPDNGFDSIGPTEDGDIDLAISLHWNDDLSKEANSSVARCVHRIVLESNGDGGG